MGSYVHVRVVDDSVSQSEINRDAIAWLPRPARPNPDGTGGFNAGSQGLLMEPGVQEHELAGVYAFLERDVRWVIAQQSLRDARLDGREAPATVLIAATAHADQAISVQALVTLCSISTGLQGLDDLHRRCLVEVTTPQ